MYQLLVTGGTFDHFHKGHEAFLRFAFAQSERVLIGLTSDAFTREKSSNGQIEPYEIRKTTLVRFLEREGVAGRADITEIDSVYIPDIWEALPIDVILVTDNTYSGAESINERRRTQGKAPLTILTCPLALAADDQPISSTRIRSGIINREGNPYISKSLSQRQLLLPDALRETLQKPFGSIINLDSFDFSSAPMEKVITVGDVTTHKFLSHGLHPHIAIIDFFVEREKKYASLQEIGFEGTEHTFHAENPAGQLTPSLFSAVQTIFAQNGNKNVLFVTGEEDLSVLPVLLYAPLTYHVFYGQPGEGAVHIMVTEEAKEEAKKIVAQFV